MRPWTLIFLSLFVLGGAGPGSSSSRFVTDFLQDGTQVAADGAGGPYFDSSVPDNLTGLVGRTAYLNCRVKNLGNRTVSWVRHRDIHLLTVGRYTYTSDQRFEALHSPHTEDWTLRIRYAQRRDSGVYECQISTTPPVGRLVQLRVVEPLTEVLGGPDLYIDKGSTINLTCRVLYAPEPPLAIVWSRDSQAINFDSPRGGISLVTEKGALTTSRLLIQRATAADSGRYTCAPSNTAAASVRVHILDGETPAAMHHGSCATGLQPPPIRRLPQLLLLLGGRDKVQQNSTKRRTNLLSENSADCTL
ncbi:zwei Ig domain protein zig-8-like [Schistocerca americana]|uniref:zwei Ig domain protein zig-8-like n=1 Tax=Schistocerca americana TaxID=7009 RepID=UPI001F4F4569|nr:zwei Ig domain protein zig-8-like [Schistocerca americana]